MSVTNSHPWRERIGTLVTVTLITAMLWIWAAGETRATDDVEFPLRLQTADELQIIVAPTDAIDVTVSLSGSTTSVRRAREVLRRMPPLALGVDGVPFAEGTHEIDLAVVLGSRLDVRESGATIDAVAPPKINLLLDAYTTQTVLVAPRLAAERLVGDAVAEPARVSVRLPQRFASRLEGLTLEAPITDAELDRLDPGRRQELDVRIQIPPALDDIAAQVRISPPSVRVGLTLADRIATLELRTVPVQIAGPPQDLAEYIVEIDDADRFLTNVILEGPPDLIERAESGREPIVALVALSSDDLASAVASAPVTLWRLPTGLRVRSVDGSTAPPIIGLSIRTR